MNHVAYSLSANTLSFNPSKKMQPQNSGSRGFGLGSIIMHSLWITVVGIVLFRLATANTQTVVYVKIFGVSGAIIATGPWIIQLLVSTTIMVLYNAHVCDLTWLVKSPSEEGCCCQDSRTGDEDIEASVWIGNSSVHRRSYGHARSNLGNKYGLLVGVNGRSGPQLHRNRTV